MTPSLWPQQGRKARMCGSFKTCARFGTALLFAAAACGAQQVTAEEVAVTCSGRQLAQEGWGKSLHAATEEFEAQEPGIRVVTEPVRLAQRDVRLATAIRAGQGPDVFALDASPVRQHISEDRALAPSRLAETRGSDLFDDFHETGLAPATVDGIVHGVPMNTVTTGLVCNRGKLEAADLFEPATSWVEFSAQADAGADQRATTRRGATPRSRAWN